MTANVTIQLPDRSYLAIVSGKLTLNGDGKDPHSQWSMTLSESTTETDSYSTIQNVGSGQWFSMPGPLIDNKAPPVLTSDSSDALTFLIGGVMINDQQPIQIVNSAILIGTATYLTAIDGTVWYAGDKLRITGWMIKPLQ